LHLEPLEVLLYLKYLKNQMNLRFHLNLKNHLYPNYRLCQKNLKFRYYH
jgi:hypothetical protein